MIKVTQKPEYPCFDRDVRQPGLEFLANCPAPKSKEFKKNDYWRRAATELHAAYSGICAYTAMYLPQQGSIDHFKPKSIYPTLAYEWSNFRLANGRVNSTKGDKAEILDPFEIEDNWFHMDIPDCLMRANPELSRDIRIKINTTINSLRLNDDDFYVQERCNILLYYAKDLISFAFILERYPFIAKEINRQSLNQNDLKELFRI